MKITFTVRGSIIYQKNFGYGDALIHGINQCKTEYFCIFNADGSFIFIGLIPNTQSFKGIVDLDHGGFIQTTALAQTSVDGIFAAGDCREGAIAQVAAATGEGVLA